MSHPPQGMPTATATRLTPVDVPGARDVLVQAFADDPLYRYLFARPVRRFALRQVLSMALELLQPEGASYVVRDNEGLAGVVLVAPPGRWPIPGGRTASVGARYLWRIWPLAPLRLLWTAYVTERTHPSPPFRLVSGVAVHPRAQGRGLGRALMVPVLAASAQDGVPVVLETSNPRNLPFYRRLGFTVRREVRPLLHPPLWSLVCG